MRLPVLALTLLLSLGSPAWSQAIRGGGNPYSSQLMTDPDAGTVQGIQRYGRPLATDPAQGSGYPYFVFPSVREPNQASPFGGSPTTPLSPLQQFQVQQQIRQLESQRAGLKALQARTQADSSLGPQAAGSPVDTAAATPAGPQSGQESMAAVVQGLSRNNAETAAQDYAILASPPSSPVFVPRPAAGADYPNAFIRHQPLVQIKLRVVEVTRSNNLSASSTLDYISRVRGAPSEFSNAGLVSPNINRNQRNLSGVSRFSVPGLLTVENNTSNSTTNLTTNLNGGAGALVNLTSEHINLVTSLLAQELNADVLTAPELVTTNGESVEFVAGTKSPFNLGTVETTSDTVAGTAIQNNVFYKHVGTYVRITPRIVNFGSYGTGRGEAPIVAADVLDWNLLIRFLINNGLAPSNSEIALTKLSSPSPQALATLDAQPHIWEPYTRPGILVPLDVKTAVLDCVNEYTRTDLRNYAMRLPSQDAAIAFEYCDMIQDCEADQCSWKPEDCSIDLEVLARFSNRELPSPGNSSPVFNAPGNLAGTNLSSVATAETGVRAIANIVQVRNGRGVVMAGLLGESDVESAAKIPVLGDLPAVGFLFRAKSVTRQKSEIVIFIEANILSDEADIARAQSAADLHLAKPYVQGETLDNPLEVGLSRAGFGAYLPPESCDEKTFWERHARRVNRIKTTTHDALR